MSCSIDSQSSDVEECFWANNKSKVAGQCIVLSELWIFSESDYSVILAT